MVIRHLTPHDFPAGKKFGGENYSFITNFGTLKEAKSLARKHIRAGYRIRIWAWVRDEGEKLFSVWSRRRKDFWSSRFQSKRRSR